MLSGGEKSRLAMIELLLEPVNLLILDEPTNHLDKPTKEVLKNAIQTFDGTAIIVSHDRAFLDGIVSKVYEFGGGKVKEHLGGIYDFLQEKQIESLKELEVADTKQKVEKSGQGNAAQDSQTKEVSESKRSYFEQKEHEKLVRQAQRKVDELEKEIEKYENEISEIEAVLATGTSDDPEIYTKHASAQKSLENAMSEWELASEKLEELSND